MPRLQWIIDELAHLAACDLRRELVVRSGPPGVSVTAGGRELLNFASNDYLNLAADPRLIQAAVQALREAGTGAAASPLVSGHTAWHERLAIELAAFEGTQAALLFPSGFAANLGTLCSLVGPGDALFSDQLNHASIIDGCRLSRASIHIFRHADWGDLESQLRRSGGFRRRLIVTDTVFSMHGDLAPLAELVKLARRYEAMLMVDEAHATGMLGQGGRGLAEQLDLEDQIDVRVGTLSKALGSSGGFVAGSHALCDWLVNQARPLIFSTASPPASAAAAAAALAIVRDEPQRRTHTLQMAAALRARLRAQGWNVGTAASQIVPIFVGQPRVAVELSAALRQRGFWVPAIRPPSVPEGQSCLRVSVTYGHTAQMLDDLLAALGDVAARRCHL
jgi:8-amino-7-oxononanoate synthase